MDGSPSLVILDWLSCHMLYVVPVVGTSVSYNRPVVLSTLEVLSGIVTVDKNG